MNTIIGALIAALIAFVSGALALLSQDADVTQKAWIILGLGAFFEFPQGLLRDRDSLGRQQSDWHW